MISSAIQAIHGLSTSPDGSPLLQERLSNKELPPDMKSILSVANDFFHYIDYQNVLQNPPQELAAKWQQLPDEQKKILFSSMTQCARSSQNPHIFRHFLAILPKELHNSFMEAAAIETLDNKSGSVQENVHYALTIIGDISDESVVSNLLQTLSQSLLTLSDKEFSDSISIIFNNLKDNPHLLYQFTEQLANTLNHAPNGTALYKTMIAHFIENRLFDNAMHLQSLISDKNLKKELHSSITKALNALPEQITTELNDESLPKTERINRALFIIDHIPDYPTRLIVIQTICAALVVLPESSSAFTPLLSDARITEVFDALPPSQKALFFAHLAATLAYEALPINVSDLVDRIQNHMNRYRFTPNQKRLVYHNMALALLEKDNLPAAIAIAKQIPNPERKATLSQLLISACLTADGTKVGDLDQIETIIKTEFPNDIKQQSHVLEMISYRLLKNGKITEAKKVAHKIADPKQRDLAFKNLISNLLSRFLFKKPPNLNDLLTALNLFKEVQNKTLLLKVLNSFLHNLPKDPMSSYPLSKDELLSIVCVYLTSNKPLPEEVKEFAKKIANQIESEHMKTSTSTFINSQ